MDRHPLLWNRRRVVVAGLLAGGAALALSGCARAPVRVGFLASLTGPAADLGLGGRDAALLAVEHWNGAGGLDGARVELVEFDDRLQPDALPDLMPAIGAAGLIGMVASITSRVARQWIPLANAQALLTISPSVASTEFSGQDDFFFRVSPSAREYARVSAEHHVRTRRWQRLAILRDDSNAAFTRNLAQHYTDRARELGAQVLHEGAYYLNEAGASLVPYIEQALAQRPDALALITNPVDSARIAQWLRKNGHAVPIALSDWAASQQLLELGGRAVEGAVLVQDFDPDNQSDTYLAFKSALENRFQREPSYIEITAYEAANVMLTAYQARAANETLRAALLRLRHFEGLQNPIAFDPFGEVQRPLLMAEVQNGRFTVVDA